MKKTLITILVTVLVCFGVVGTTFAWLVASTQPVKNTFTVGNITISLTETTTEYKMIPGREIAKDPKITVDGGSEACWLFVKVDKSANFDTYMTYTAAEGWTELTTDAGVYYRKVDANAAKQEFAVLKGNIVTVKDTVTRDQLITANTNQPTLTFTAYAVQSEGVADAPAAWAIANPTNNG